MGIDSLPGIARRLTWPALVAAALMLPHPAASRLVDAVGNYDAAAGVMPPAKLSATGLYTNIGLKTRIVTDGIVPYEVNTALWSDAAHKERWVTLPVGTSIVPTDSDHYAFPDKTIMVKNFALDTVVGDASTALLVETRFMVIRKIGTSYSYRGISYAWRRDQTDADLVDPSAGLNALIPVKANGTAVNKRWRYPARGDCTVCHVNRGSLGFITPQLNRPSKANASINQLQALMTAGILSKNPLTANPNAMKWAALDDATASLELRARSYLAANCSHCHGNDNRSFTGVGHNFDMLNANMKFMYDPNDAGTSGPYVGTPSFYDPDYPELVKKGAPDSSFVLKRMLSRGTFEAAEILQMPQLATYQPDSSALRVLADWICTMGNKPKGAACHLPDVPQDHYWAPATGIRSHGLQASAAAGFSAFLRGGILTVQPAWTHMQATPAAVTGVGLTDVDGKAIALRALGEGRYAVPSGLPKGVYFVRWAAGFSGADRVPVTVNAGL